MTTTPLPRPAPSTRRRRTAPVLRLGLALSLALAGGTVSGCSAGADQPESVGVPATGLPADPSADGAVRIFLLTADGPWPVWRDVDGPADPQAVADALAVGPLDDERERGLTSALPSGEASVLATATRDGVVDVTLPWTLESAAIEAVGQLVCSLAAAPGVPGGLAATDVVVSLSEPPPFDAEPTPVRCDADGVLQTIGAS